MHIFASLTDCYHFKHRRNGALHMDVYRLVTQPKGLNVTILWQVNLQPFKEYVLAQKARMLQLQTAIEEERCKVL